MSSIDFHRRLLRHDDWANRETLAAIRAARVASDRSSRLLAHIVAAEWLWLARMKREPAPMAVWPELDATSCELEIGRLAEAWRAFFASMKDSELQRSVTYTNSLGQPWTSTAGDILTHVAMHSTYHRGQIASDLRLLGEKPAYTDFIHAVRQGLVE